MKPTTLHHSSFFRISFFAAMVFTLLRTGNTYACDRSFGTLDSARFNGTNYEFYFTMCFGGGRTSTAAGGDQPTGTFGFDIFTSCPATNVVNVEQDTVCPDIIIAGSTGCYRNTAIFCGASIPGSQVRGQDCWVRYNAVNLGEFFTCISSTSACGDTHTVCRQFMFETDCPIDSVVATGMEGASNQTNSCWTLDHSGMVIANPTPLEVTWGPLSAAAAQDGIMLDWLTYSEINTDHYEIMRSPNGTDFQSLGFRSAMGRPSTQWNQYQFFDTEPLTGINYYRIVQTDIYGKTQLSEVFSAMYTPVQTASIYAISAGAQSGQLSVTLLSPENMHYTAEVFSISGQRLLTSAGEVHAGSNPISLDISGLASGIYILRINGKDVSLEQKFMKF